MTLNHFFKSYMLFHFKRDKCIYGVVIVLYTYFYIRGRFLKKTSLGGILLKLKNTETQDSNKIFLKQLIKIEFFITAIRGNNGRIINT